MTAEEYAWLVSESQRFAGLRRVRDHLELVSAAWEGLERARKAYDPVHSSGASFRTFARYRVRGQMLDHVRPSKSKHKVPVGLLGDSDRKVVARSIAQQLDARDHVAAILRRLTYQQREAFVLREGFGIPQVEIASRLGVSPSRVSRLLGEARGRLRRSAVPA